MERNTQIQWLGHATFVVSTAGRRILIDPWLQGNPACPTALKDPSPVDAILVTHAHGDHIADCPSVAIRTGAPVVCVPETGRWLQGKGVKNTIGMNKGGTAEVAGVRVTMVHADHTCGISDGAQTLYGGEAVGFIIQCPNGPRLWHMGDTAVFGDMALIADLYKPDAVMMPIGDHFVMSPLEAERAVRLTMPKVVIPMHFGTFSVLKGTPAELRERTKDLAGVRIVEMEPGETICV